jgi:hypothetical protein
MILNCNYEEVTALTYGARAVLDDGERQGSPVAAPSAGRAAVEALLPRLTGDLSVRTIAAQREIERAVEVIVSHLRKEMDARVVAMHPAAEEAVSAYFDFAHALAVLDRVQELGREMRALVEVMTGRPPTEEVIRVFQFPD